MGLSERKRAIKNTFDTVAAGYDGSFLRFFASSGDYLVRHIAPRGDELAADLACGTGAVSLPLARALPAGQVTSIDLSEGMLERLREKAQLAEIGNISVCCADWEMATDDQEKYDIVTCGFGIFFLENMAAGMSAIRQKLKPGGVAGITSFHGMAFSPMSDRFLEQISAYGIDPPKPGWFQINNEKAHKELFDSAGFSDVVTEVAPMGFYLEGVNGWWDIVWNAGYRGIVNQLSPEQQLEFKARHLASLEDLLEPEGLPLKVDVLFSKGFKVGQ